MIKETSKDWIFLLLSFTVAVVCAFFVWSFSNSIEYASTGMVGISTNSNRSLVVNIPKPNSVIVSPMHVQGSAKSMWFFEGSFPVRIEDDEGNILGQGSVSPSLDSMKKKMVPYVADVVFERGDKVKGFVVLTKDDLGGLLKVESRKIPVLFE